MKMIYVEWQNNFYLNLTKCGINMEVGGSRVRGGTLTGQVDDAGDDDDSPAH